MKQVVATALVLLLTLFLLPLLLLGEEPLAGPSQPPAATGTLPIDRTVVTPGQTADGRVQVRVALEEERRLFYVGATRARRQLVLLTCDNRFGEPSPPASFVGQFLGTPEWASQRPGTPGKAPAEPDAAAVAAWEKDYLPGTAVVHRAFGPGMVVSRSGAVAVIAFDEVGTKKVELTACLRKRLLRLASAPDF